MTIDRDCPQKSNVTLASIEEVEAAMADFPFDAAEPDVAACFASELSPGAVEGAKQVVSSALKAVEAKQEQRRIEIAAASAKRARDDYALKKGAETGEPPRPYKNTGIATRHYANGHFQFETEEEYKLRYDRERKRATRPKFVPLTDEQKKARKKASNAKRSPRKIF